MVEALDTKEPSTIYMLTVRKCGHELCNVMQLDSVDFWWLLNWILIIIWKEWLHWKMTFNAKLLCQLLCTCISKHEIFPKMRLEKGFFLITNYEVTTTYNEHQWKLTPNVLCLLWYIIVIMILLTQALKHSVNFPDHAWVLIKFRML